MNSIIRAAVRLAFKPAHSRILAIKPTLVSQPSLQQRWAHNAPLTYDFARERIMLVLHLFDKIDPNKLTLDSHFIDDLGLDSLDHVEIIMQLEDEFLFEIPDRDAERLLRPSDILRYITDKEEAYKELQDMHAHHHHHGEHDDHGHHEHHGEASTTNGQGHSSHDPKLTVGTNTTQKREFSSLSYISKRYKKLEYPTSFYADPPKEVKLEDFQERVLKVCAKYDKIDSTKLHLTSHFVEDLGLDSLDHVEIMMELEDEFGLEIPDQDAEKLLRPIEIARFIFEKESTRRLDAEDRPY